MSGIRDAGLVVIVEDDRKIAELVSLYLRREGFSVRVAHEGRSGLQLALETEPVFVVLDLMLPGMDGRDICRELRARSAVPILILTAREDEVDRVHGLSIGADDYMVKPFSPRELVARVKAILRRTRVAASESSGPLQHGELVLDPDKRRVLLNGERVALTRAEFTLLHALMKTPGHVQSRAQLLAHLYPNGAHVVDRVVDVHIGKLRQKIEPNASSPVYVLTERGFGYCFAESPPEGAPLAAESPPEGAPPARKSPAASLAGDQVTRPGKS